MILDPHEIELILSRPAPYLRKGLESFESPIVPQYRDERTDIATNLLNASPVGTGPFVFKGLVPGSHAFYEGHPNYWEAGKPYLDQ